MWSLSYLRREGALENDMMAQPLLLRQTFAVGALQAFTFPPPLIPPTREQKKTSFRHKRIVRCFTILSAVKIFQNLSTNTYPAPHAVDINQQILMLASRHIAIIYILSYPILPYPILSYPGAACADRSARGHQTQPLQSTL